jgi:hypothetical protein
MIESARANLKTKPERIFEENLSRGEKFLRGLAVGRLAADPDGAPGRVARRRQEGPWHDNLWNLASDAQGDEYGMQEKVTKVVTDALEDMPAEMRRSASGRRR